MSLELLRFWTFYLLLLLYFLTDSYLHTGVVEEEDKPEGQTPLCRNSGMLIIRLPWHLHPLGLSYVWWPMTLHLHIFLDRILIVNMGPQPLGQNCLDNSLPPIGPIQLEESLTWTHVAPSYQRSNYILMGVYKQCSFACFCFSNQKATFSF